MFDKALAKDEFCKKLKNAGYTPEEVDELWNELLNIFYTQVLLKASTALSPEQLKETVGKEGVSAEEIPQMFESLSKYLQEHAKEVDTTKVLEESIKEAYSIMSKKLSGKEENKND